MHSSTFINLASQPPALALCLGLLASSVPQLVSAQALPLPQPPSSPKLVPDRRLTLSVGALYTRYDDCITVGCSPNPTVYSHRSNAGGAEAAYQWSPTVGHPFDAVGGVWAGSETLGVYQDPAGNVNKALGPHYPAGSMGFISANLRLPVGLNALSLEPYVASNFGRHYVASMQLHYALAQ